MKDQQINLKTKAYDYIKALIISGEYPPNHIISEEIIQKELNMSRTPVREALIKLQSENFINILPRRGVFVAPITIKKAREIFEIRNMIEPQIVAQITPTIDKEELKKIRMKLTTDLSHFTKAEKKEFFIKVDSTLHMFLYEQNGNETLIKTMEAIIDQNQRFRFSTFFANSRDENTLKEHLEIIDAMMNDDAEGARDAMIRHLKASLDVTINYFVN